MTFDLSTKQCEYKNGILSFSGEVQRPQKEYNVASHKTGRIVKFVYDEEDMMEHEFYDGLYATYKPVEECGIKRLVVMTGC